NRAYEPYAIVVDYNNVYWTNIAQGSVMFLPLSGEIPDGGPSQLSQFHEQPYWLAVSQDALYWTDFGVSSNGSVWRFVFDGGYDGGDCLPRVNWAHLESPWTQTLFTGQTNTVDK